MILLEVAFTRANVHYGRHPSSVSGGEAALVEVHFFHHVAVERGEQAHKVGNLVQRDAVQQEQVVRAVAAMDVESGHQLRAPGYAGHHLERLYDVGSVENGESAAQDGAVKALQARLGGGAVPADPVRHYAGLPQRVRPLNLLAEGGDQGGQSQCDADY